MHLLDVALDHLRRVLIGGEKLGPPRDEIGQRSAVWRRVVGDRLSVAEHDDLVRAETATRWVRAGSLPALHGVREGRRDPRRVALLLAAAALGLLQPSYAAADARSQSARIVLEAEQRLARRMRDHGLPILEFVGNHKTRASLVTKLLAKKESVAAQVFDRVRYRIVTERRDQLAPVLSWLAHHLFPFNYGVPGQTQNTLVRFRRIVGAHPRAEEMIAALQVPLELEAGETLPFNEFSAKDYRVLNFVVDLPVRVDELMPEEEELTEDLGRVVFSLVEFQIVDADTHARNEHVRVDLRLDRGEGLGQRLPQECGNGREKGDENSQGNNAVDFASSIILLLIIHDDILTVCRSKDHA